MRSISILKVAVLSIMLMAMPAIAAAQGTNLAGNVYLMSATINLTPGQAAGIDFCNVDTVARDVKLFILDANGNVLKSANDHVLPGQTVGIWFEFSALPRGAAMRVPIRGAMVVVDPPNPDVDPPQPDHSLGSIEVYDVLTGRTSFGLLVPAVRSANVVIPTDQ